MIIEALPQIIQALLIAAGALGAYYMLKQEIALVKAEMRHIAEGQKALTEAFTQLGKILTQVAVQDSRINMIEKRLDELSHGQGFVVRKK